MSNIVDKSCLSIMIDKAHEILIYFLHFLMAWISWTLLRSMYFDLGVSFAGKHLRGSGLVLLLDPSCL